MSHLGRVFAALSGGICTASNIFSKQNTYTRQMPRRGNRVTLNRLLLIILKFVTNITNMLMLDAQNLHCYAHKAHYYANVYSHKKS